MFKKVLAATDLLESCDAVVLVAGHIAERHGGTLYVLHVLESPYSGKFRNFVKDFRTGEELVSNEQYEGIVQEQIERACAGVLQDPQNYRMRISPGFPWEQILRWARKEAVDLIVLGPPSGRAEMKGVVRVSGTVGSTVEGVITHERCPVMIVNRLISKQRLAFKNIMVCIDFSESSRCALDFAVKMAGKYGARVLLFHSLAAPTSPQYPQAEFEGDLAAARVKLESFSENTLTGIEHEYAVWEGTLPHIEILKFAREKDVDLIAMGSHSKEKGDKWYIGSAVEQVGSRAACPVAVLTDPKVLRKMEE
ncbi:MAG: universal stress protein [Deltaproteobacteria bacterium]|nr:universal stress protein [Deltaproteobacteria bacterium]